jgi:Tol biopolymer transport system component
MTKKIHPLLTVLFIVVAASSAQAQELPVLEGPYLGQEPPGEEAELFAPGFISTEHHEFSCCLSPDGREFYFTRRIPGRDLNRILVTRLEESGWTEPQPAPMAGVSGGFEPTLSPDGKRLYFQATELDPHLGPSMDVWYTERTSAGWNGPTKMGDPFNPGKAMYVTETSNGTIYTTDISQGPGTERLVLSRPADGNYSEYEPLPSPVNSPSGEIYPFIAPDESYIVFTSLGREGGRAAGLYVSFRSKQGSWSEPAHVATGQPSSAMPWVSPDGKYLFFTSKSGGLNGDIYWVDAAVFKKLRPENLE